MDCLRAVAWRLLNKSEEKIYLMVQMVACLRVVVQMVVCLRAVVWMVGYLRAVDWRVLNKSRE